MRDGEAMEFVTPALIDIQNRRKSGDKDAYLAKTFFEYLSDEWQIRDLKDVEAMHIARFAEHLLATPPERGRRKSEDGNSAPRSNASLERYASLLDRIFEEMYMRGVRPHISLIWGDSSLALSGPPRNRRKTLTLAGFAIRKQKNPKEKPCPDDSYLYSKWLTPEQIEMVYRSLPLRDRCIFLIGLETGYRISSVLSIQNVADNIRNRFLQETFSKTGRLHAAMISQRLQADIINYVRTERANIVSEAGFDCGALFLAAKGKNKGKALTEDAFSKRLKAVEQKINAAYPENEKLNLHSHAGRSTYFNRLMRQNLERKRSGEKHLSDIEICQLMDWASMASLEHYYNYREHSNDGSVLYQDYFVRMNNYGDSDECEN